LLKFFLFNHFVVIHIYLVEDPDQAGLEVLDFPLSCNGLLIGYTVHLSLEGAHAASGLDWRVAIHRHHLCARRYDHVGVHFTYKIQT
jgi:hypothetical protein